MPGGSESPADSWSAVDQERLADAEMIEVTTFISSCYLTLFPADAVNRSAARAGQIPPYDTIAEAALRHIHHIFLSFSILMGGCPFSEIRMTLDADSADEFQIYYVSLVRKLSCAFSLLRYPEFL